MLLTAPRAAEVPAFFQAARYLPGIPVDLLDPTAAEIERQLRG